MTADKTLDRARRETFKEAVLNRRMLICVFTGFTSGLPLYVLFQLIPGWLRVEGVGLAEIGFFALVQFPYTWKFLWSPFMDRFSLPFLGHRRGWMLLTQVALLLSMGVMATPRQARPPTALGKPGSMTPAGLIFTMVFWVHIEFQM